MTGMLKQVQHDNVFRMTMVLLACDVFDMRTTVYSNKLLRGPPIRAEMFADPLAALDNVISRAVEPPVIASVAKQSHQCYANHPVSPRLLQ